MARDFGVFGSAKIIAACTLLSRITGLARDVALNWAFGQNWIQDAFNFGFQIPNLFRRLFGEGALAAVFVPEFTAALDRGGPAAAESLLGRTSGLLTLVLTLLLLALEGLLLLLLWFVLPGNPMRHLMLGLTAVMLPLMLSLCLLALFSSILNCLDRFAVPALLPIVLNVCNLCGVLFVGPMLGEPREVQVYGVALSVLAAGVIQLLIVLPVLRRAGLTWRMSFAGSDPHVRTMLAAMTPVLIGQGVLLINVYLDAQICTLLTRGPGQPEAFSIAGWSARYPLAEGALSAVTNAARLYQFPLGVLAISLATAAFPLLSRHAARGDLPAFRDAVGSSLRLAVFEGFPAGLLMIVLAEPIVALLFEYGRFGPEQTERAARVLRVYGLGMWAFCAQHIVTRGFYSLRDTRTPMWIGCALVALTQAMNLALVWHPAVAEAAFGLSTSVTAALSVVIGLVILRRRAGGRLGGRALAAAFARMILLGLLALLAAVGAQRALGDWTTPLGGRLLSRGVHVFVPMSAALLVYLGAARLLRMEEVGWLLGGRRPERGPDDGAAAAP